MRRFISEKLDEWVERGCEKPLLLHGARQVGKTWLMKDLGERLFGNVVYISFDNDKTMCSLFNEDFNIDRILLGIQAITQQTITPRNTLLIFDEIQECPLALTSLKYFHENAPQYPIIAAGSLLGITLREGTGFPVGKVDILHVYPLSFPEYLEHTNPSLASALASADTALITALHTPLTQALREYYYVGGMPEIVDNYSKNHDFTETHRRQNTLLESYRLDITKHLDARQAEKCLAIWDSIPTHLGRENKKFVFSRLRPSARAKDYEEGITWLKAAGLIHQVQRISKPNLPLSAYTDNSAFKIFIHDLGLLGALSRLDAATVVREEGPFEEFKGALTEQYVAQQLVSLSSTTPFYWSASNSSGEIDFLIQDESTIYAIEVKARENLKSKSLRAFTQKYPDVRALRFSLANYRKQDWLINIPLYALSLTSLWH